MEIGFNVNYLLDALAAVDSEQVEFGVTDGELQLPDPRARQRAARSSSSCRCASRRRHSRSPRRCVLPLSRVRITTLRCLSEVELDLDPASQLHLWAQRRRQDEPARGIFVLGRGRSFRTRQDADGSIRYGATGLAVFGRPRSTGSVSGDSAWRIAGRAAREADRWRSRPSGWRSWLAAARARDRSGMPRDRRGRAQRAAPLPRLGSVPRGTCVPRGLATLPPSPGQRNAALERGRRARPSYAPWSVAGRGRRRDRSIVGRRYVDRLAAMSSAHGRRIAGSSGRGARLPARLAQPSSDLDEVLAARRAVRDRSDRTAPKPAPSRRDLVLAARRATGSRRSLARAAEARRCRPDPRAGERGRRDRAAAAQRAARRRSRGRARCRSLRATAGRDRRTFRQLVFTAPVPLGAPRSRRCIPRCFTWNEDRSARYNVQHCLRDRISG